MLDDLEMLAMDYRDGQADQRRLWRPVIGKIAQWRRFHEGRGNSSQPALGYRDGGELPHHPPGTWRTALPCMHRLRGLSRGIYLFCGRIRTREEIQQQFPSLSAATLDRFLAELRQKRLLFQEDEQVLALADPPVITADQVRSPGFGLYLRFSVPTAREYTLLRTAAFISGNILR